MTLKYCLGWIILAIAASATCGYATPIRAQEARQASCEGALVKSKGWMTDGLGADIGGICKLSRADAAAVLLVCGYGPCEVAGTVTDCPVECLRFIHITSIRRANAPAPSPVIADNATPNEGRAECFLSVDGKVRIDRICAYSRESDGSFSIGANVDHRSSNGFYPDFAYVNTNDDGTASGRWNDGASHANEELGTFTRSGACWANDHARVCAWKIGMKP